MIYVDQERVGSPMGQCTEAAVASLLECDLQDVPELWHPSDPPGHRDPGNYRWWRMLGFIVSRGLYWVDYQLPERPATDLAEALASLPPVAQRLATEAGCMVGGKNRDGVGHWVVSGGGEYRHDPNPSRRFLETIDSICVLWPLEELPPRLFGTLGETLKPSKSVPGHWVRHDADESGGEE